MTHTMIEPLAAVATPETLRTAYGRFPTGVVAVCADVDGTREVLVASSFVTVSLDPPLVAFFPQKTSTTWPRLAHAGRLGVSILAEHQHTLARSMASKNGDRFAGAEVVAGNEGALFVGGASAWLETTVDGVVPTGDHDCVLLRVEGAALHEPGPTVFHTSRFQRLVDLDA
ncbi:flavin reductase family protein [Arthrobacter ginkgonis]|uniref:Flavin reductase family protein n=1 Tax=Arthrobacter ginkgonis TaxID=1630594 RepID=A0ABP7C460_9MICC